MRHFLLSRPPAAHPGRVHAAASMARLVAPPGPLDGSLPGRFGTAAGAVDLAAVAATANDHLPAAAGAQEQTARWRLGIACLTELAWTNAVVGRIVGLHACPARCGARRRCRTARLRARRRAYPQTLAGSCRAVLVAAGFYDRSNSRRSPAAHPLSRLACHARSHAAGQCSPPLTRASSPPLTLNAVSKLNYYRFPGWSVVCAGQSGCRRSPGP